MPRALRLMAVLAALLIGAAARVASAIKPITAQVDQAKLLQRNLSKIKLPPGFEITLYAIAPGARTIAVGPQGKIVFVGTLGAAVYALPVRPGPELVSEIWRFADLTPMKMPHGLCFAKDGTLFIAEQNQILAFANAEEHYNDPAVWAKTVVAQGALIPREVESDVHSARVCRIGPDGKLYVAIGEPYNVPPKDKQAEFVRLGVGAIIRMDRDGQNREMFARGIRNSVGMDFNPADGTLWFTDNQVDVMGDDIPPGELNRAPRPARISAFPGTAAAIPAPMNTLTRRRPRMLCFRKSRWSRTPPISA